MTEKLIMDINDFASEVSEKNKINASKTALFE